jgi:hypothetical protein
LALVGLTVGGVDGFASLGPSNRNNTTTRSVRNTTPTMAMVA